jgi:predicted transcriptional regulator
MIQPSSLRAYYEIQRTLHPRQKQVFIALSSVPDATNRELEAMTGLRINEITPRVKELREKGVVVQSCERRCKQSKTTRLVIAWRSVAPSLPPAFEEEEVDETKQTLF